jgi:hypothetical protein
MEPKWLWHWQTVTASRYEPELAVRNESVITKGQAATRQQCVDAVNKLEHPPYRVNIWHTNNDPR